MVSITSEQLYAWIAGFIWPLARVLALLGTAPMFSESGVPQRIRLGVGILLTLVISPALGPLPTVNPASYEGLWILVQQILIGVLLGLTMQVVFAIVRTTGEFIGLQMGLSFATFFDPGTQSNTAVLGRLFHWVTLMVLIALDAHLLMLAGLVHSFEVVPVSATPFSINGVGAFLEWSAQIIQLGLVLSLPLVTALLTMNLAMGILNRTAPQLSVFAVGFPLALLAGLVMLIIVVPNTTPFLERLISMALDAFSEVALQLRP